MSIYPLHFSTNRALHCIRSVMKVVLGLTLVTLPINAYCTTLTEDDIKKIAAQSSVQMKGVEMGLGVTGRQVISMGRNLVFQYDVPDDWQPHPNARRDIISNSKKTGSAERWFNEKIDISFVYFKKNSAPVMIRIESGEYSSINFDLGEYISIKNHPKSKDINFKIKPPKDWLVEEGNGPNVVKKFTHKNKTFSILTKDGPTFATRSFYKELYSDDSTVRDFAEGTLPCTPGKLIDFDLVTVGLHPAVKVEFACDKEMMGIQVTYFAIAWNIFYEDKMVMLMGMGFNEVEFVELKKLYSIVAVTASFPEQFN
jgi:hypothetical protein